MLGANDDDEWRPRMRWRRLVVLGIRLGCNHGKTGRGGSRVCWVWAVKGWRKQWQMNMERKKE